MRKRSKVNKFFRNVIDVEHGKWNTVTIRLYENEKGQRYQKFEVK